MKNNHSGINQKSNFVLSEMFYNQIGITSLETENLFDTK